MSRVVLLVLFAQLLVTSQGTRPPGENSTRSSHQTGSFSLKDTSQAFVSRVCQIARGKNGFTRPPPVRLALVLTSFTNFGREARDFVRSLVREFSVSASGTRIAVVLRTSGIPRVAFGFRKFHNLECTLKAILRLQFSGGVLSGTSQLLDYTRRKLFTRGNGLHSKAANVVFVISDGWTGDKHLLSASRRLRRRGVELFILVVGGRHLERQKMEFIASKPISKHVLLLRSHSDLAVVKKKLKKQGFNRRCSGKGRIVYDECNRRCECNNERPTNCYRVRKEFTSMSLKERRRYIKTFKRISTKMPYKREFDRLTKYHSRYFNRIHKLKFFFPWHRWYLLKFENLLRQADCKVTVPYWDWSRAVSERRLWRATHIRDIWNPGPHGLGGNGKGGCVLNGPFADNRWAVSKWVHDGCLTRNFHFKKQSKMPNHIFVRRMLKWPLAKFKRFEDRVREFMHKIFHTAIGGAMAVRISANAPEFWFHHAFLDKIWSDWQKRGSPYKFHYYRNVRQRIPGCWCRGWNFVDLDRQPKCTRAMYDEARTNQSTRRPKTKSFGVSYDHEDDDDDGDDDDDDDDDLEDDDDDDDGDGDDDDDDDDKDDDDDGDAF